MRGLLDTSIVVALEVRRPVLELPDEAALSVVTVEELALGVKIAELDGRSEQAAVRQATLTAVLATFELLPVTTAVALESAALRARGRAAGVRYTPFDALICATAIVAGLPLFTQDQEMATVDGLDVRVV